MCVLAIAWQASPRWTLVVAANRDELHDRPAAPLDRWADGSGIIAGRDLVSGGSWLGVSEAGRFAAVTNVIGLGTPDPAAPSRGRLVADVLAGDADDGGGTVFNPFNLVAVTDRDAWLATNRPVPQREALPPGIRGIANATLDERWPKAEALARHVGDWSAEADPVDALLDRLGPPEATEAPLPVRSAIFIRDALYGTRCSTVITIAADGAGVIVERRYAADATVTGETRLDFRWPADIRGDAR